MRDICKQYFIDHPSVIGYGGPGIEVEIHESKFGKRKYNRGRQVIGHKVFGGIERVSGSRMFLGRSTTTTCQHASSAYNSIHPPTYLPEYM